MRIVVDTNVLVSGAFFGGGPFRILMACIEGTFQLVLSPDILREYRRAGRVFSGRRANSAFDKFLGHLVAQALIVDAPGLNKPISRDPHDDKFIACAVAGGVDVIVSGDKDLLDIPSRLVPPVMKPRAFIDRYMGSQQRH